MGFFVNAMWQNYSVGHVAPSMHFMKDLIGFHNQLKLRLQHLSLTLFYRRNPHPRATELDGDKDGQRTLLLYFSNLPNYHTCRKLPLQIIHFVNGNKWHNYYLRLIKLNCGEFRLDVPDFLSRLFSVQKNVTNLDSIYILIIHMSLNQESGSN